MARNKSFFSFNDDDEPVIDESPDVSEPESFEEGEATDDSEVKSVDEALALGKESADLADAADSDPLPDPVGLYYMEPKKGEVTSVKAMAEEGKALIRSLWPSKMIIKGAPSGATYKFDQAGDVVQVAEEDVSYFLSINRNTTRGCCGAGEKVKFELI